MQKNVVFWWDELLQVCGWHGTTFRVGQKIFCAGRNSKNVSGKRSGTFKRRIFQTSAGCRTDLIGAAPTFNSSLPGLISEITMKPGEIDLRFKAFHL